MAKIRYALPPEFRDQLQQQRRDARKAAANFAAVCSRGDADELYNAGLWLDECVDAWRLAMAKVARLPAVSRSIQEAFVPIWVEHKMLPLNVGNRPVLVRALRVLMCSSYTGSPLTLYRGTTNGERRRHLYGFSWTTDQTKAREFAEQRTHPEFQVEGVVLQAVVPAEAILLVRKPEDYYDEGEVVVDPFGIGRIRVIERLRERVGTVIASDGKPSAEVVPHRKRRR
jgi:hypothetical protein